MHRSFFIFLSIVFLNSGSALGQLEFSGYVRHYEAIRLHGDNDFMINRNRFRINVEHFGDTSRLFASLDFRNDTNIDARSVTTTLRELYIDLNYENVDLRIGKQQIVWGKIDGLFVNDIVNPLDLELFILQDFEDIRIGMPAVKSELFFGDNTLELVWLPQFEPVHTAPPGSDWEFSQQTPSSGIFLPPQKIDNNLSNSEYGMRFSTFKFNTDLAFIYFNTRDDFPSIHTSNYICPDGFICTGEIKFQFEPRYYPMSVYGANFSTVIGSVVFRGEGGIHKEKYFNADLTNHIATGGLLPRSYLQYAFGADIGAVMGISSSVQLIDRRILDYEPDILDDESSQIGTIRLSSNHMNETLQLNLLALHDLSGDGTIVRFISDYDVMDGVDFVVGFDLISGESDNFFGQFVDNDLAYFKLKYSF